MQQLASDLVYLGGDWWLSRLSMGLHVPGGGMSAPFPPAYHRDRLDFRDTLELHLLMDIEEARIDAIIAAMRKK